MSYVKLKTVISHCVKKSLKFKSDITAPREFANASFSF